jgi:hypothetical protein
MAPKKEAAPPAEVGDADGFAYPEWSDERLAAEAFSSEEPYEDPHGATLPEGFVAGMV